jgi:hypothetical protein
MGGGPSENLCSIDLLLKIELFIIYNVFQYIF